MLFFEELAILVMDDAFFFKQRLKLVLEGVFFFNELAILFVDDAFFLK